jgi:DnaJ-class molecular chaperone
MSVVGKEWESVCKECCGGGYIYTTEEAETVEDEACEACDGKGYIDRREE